AMASQEPRSIYDVGPALTNQLNQLGVFLGGELEVGVLDDDEIPRHSGKPAAQRRSLSLVDRLTEQLEMELVLERVEHGAGAVGRAVVHDDQLDAQTDGEDAADVFVDRLPFVKDGHHDR